MAFLGRNQAAERQKYVEHTLWPSVWERSAISSQSTLTHSGMLSFQFPIAFVGHDRMEIALIPHAFSGNHTYGLHTRNPHFCTNHSAFSCVCIEHIQQHTHTHTVPFFSVAVYESNFKRNVTKSVVCVEWHELDRLSTCHRFERHIQHTCLRNCLKGAHIPYTEVWRGPVSSNVHTMNSRTCSFEWNEAYINANIHRCMARRKSGQLISGNGSHRMQNIDKDTATATRKECGEQKSAVSGSGKLKAAFIGGQTQSNRTA